MGLDAAVACRCYQQGRVVSPFPEQTIIDAEGCVELDWPYTGHEAEHDLFYTWTESACEHPRMNYCWVHLANWAGYRLFQEALSETGWEHFPTLNAHLPNANEGTMAAQAAVVALRELETFKQIYHGTQTVLVSETTSEVERTSIKSYDGIFLFGPRYQVGFDSRGLFVREAAEPHRELFRSLWFEQRLTPVQGNLPLASGTDAYEVTLIDLETGQQFASPVAVTQSSAAPCRWRVEERKQTAERFAYILESLVEICQAAVETGNPVRWC